MSTQPSFPAPVPRSCTTAREVRAEGCEPAMNITARGQRKRELLARMAACARELAEITLQDEADARRIAALCDHAAARLDHAERKGSYEAVPGDVSEMPTGRKIAARAREAIKTLADPKRPREHPTARADLHALFQTFGDELFEPRVTGYMGAQQVLAMRGEFAAWTAQL